jgi:hypothetical protein
MSTSVAPSFHTGQRGAHGLLPRRRQAFAEVFFRHADAQAGQRLAQFAREVFVHAAQFRRQRGRIALVEAGHGVQQQRAVFGGLGHRAALVQRRGKRDHAEARHAAVGRLDAGDAAERGRLADRAAGVGAGGGRRQARGHGGRAREPPGTAVLSHGFFTAPKAEFSLAEPMANSSQLSLPSVTMPAARNFSTTVASNGLT